MGEGEEEGPCTSYSHKEEELKHEEHLEFEIISEYLSEYGKNPRVFQETIFFTLCSAERGNNTPQSWEDLRQ